MSQLTPAHTYEEVPSEFPFNSAGSANEMFPALCIRSHWDPTAMLRYILPQGNEQPLPMDFRPYVKVCKDYVTSAPAEVAPMPPNSMVFPSGGEFYPPGRYSAAIDAESSLHWLDHRLDKWCPPRKYQMPKTTDIFTPNVTVPARNMPMTPIMSELAMPRVLLKDGENHCRAENDTRLWERSPRLFNNPTKQDRYGAQTFSALPGGVVPMPHGGVDMPPLTQQAQRGAYPIPQPGSSGKRIAGIQPIYENNPRNNYVNVVGTGTTGSQAPA